MTPEITIYLAIIFFIISVLYSSAGFGGGSSYLAFLALFSVDFILMKSIALLCNIVVVIGNLVVFSKNDLLKLKQAVPLAIISTPLAFLGGLYSLKASMFFILLGSALIAAALLLIIKPKQKDSSRIIQKQAVAVGSSMGIGLLSGLVGIGGGIFLSPVLHLINWDTPKRIAATASFFILVNSLAGIAGHFIRSTPGGELWSVLPLLAAVILGGQIGSWITTYRFKQFHVKLVTSLIVLITGLKILIDHF